MGAKTDTGEQAVMGDETDTGEQAAVGAKTDAGVQAVVGDKTGAAGHPRVGEVRKITGGGDNVLPAAALFNDRAAVFCADLSGR